MGETADWEGTTETSETVPGTKRSPETTGFCRRIKTNMQVNRSDFGIRDKTEPYSLCML